MKISAQIEGLRAFTGCWREIVRGEAGEYPGERLTPGPGRARRPAAANLPGNQCSSEIGLREGMCGWAGDTGSCTHLADADPGYHSSRGYSAPRSVAPHPAAQPWRGCLHPQPRPKPFLAHRVHCQRPKAFMAGTRGFRAMSGSWPRPLQQRRAHRSSPSSGRRRPTRPSPSRTLSSVGAAEIFAEGISI